MPRMSISAVFADRARRHPDQVMVRDRHTSATTAEVDRWATSVARILHARGVGRDDRVILALPNSVDFVVAAVAIWRAGATPMPLSPNLPHDERRQVEDAARPAAAFGPPPQRADIAWVDTHSLAGRASTGSEEDLPDTWASSWKAPCTSGSSGRPKVVASTAPALVDPDASAAPFLPRDAVQLVTSPMWHSTAFTYAFRGLTCGHRLVIEPQFAEHTFLDLVEAHRITWTVLSPPSIRRLLRLPAAARTRRDLSSLESVLHLGGRCPVPDKRALIDWLGPHRVVEVYAGTESNGLTMITGDEWLTHPGSVGRPIAGTELAIRRGDGSTAAPGETGEIWMRRGSASAYRYLGASSVRTADGWDTLGDLGFVDGDGFLTVLDRAGDAIERNGQLVYPADIEETFEQHPLVRGAVAVGEPGTAELTVVVDVADADVDVATMQAHALDHLPPAARPHRVCLTHTPLRNDAGKIRRTALVGCGPRFGADPPLRTNGARR